MLGITINEINIKNPRELQEVRGFLKDFSLTIDKDIDYSLALKRDHRLIATCSKEKNVIKSFAILPEYQGEGLAATMITRLMDKLLEEGHETFFVFTKPANKGVFTSLGFQALYEGKNAVLLESGFSTIKDYLKKQEFAKKWVEESNSLVRKKAEELIDYLKENSKTYGEMKKNLRELIGSARWKGAFELVPISDLASQIIEREMCDLKIKHKAD